MNRSNPLILQVHLPGAEPYEIGDEIWQQPLADAIRAEAEVIAEHAGRDLLPIPSQATRAVLRDRISADMTAALRHAETPTRRPTASLTRSPTRRSLTSHRATTPVVEEVLRFDNLPVGSSATRAAFVRWSDGTESQALAWYDDEILICEGDLLGKTKAELRSLHFRRDRDWLQS